MAVINGNEYRFYDRENEQVTIGTITEKNQQWIWQLLYSPGISDIIQCDLNRRVILLKDKSEELDYELYVGPDDLLQKVIHRDPTGAANVYLFSQYQPRLRLQEDDFLLALPEGIEIIDNRK